MKIFCERLKELREEHKLSLSQLGKAIGVNASSIDRWEKGLRSPVVENLYNLAVYFKVSADYLIGLENY